MAPINTHLTKRIVVRYFNAWWKSCKSSHAGPSSYQEKTNALPLTKLNSSNCTRYKL